MAQLPRMQRVQIAALALVDERAVERCYSDAEVRTGTLLRVAEAAKKLGYPVPDRAAALVAQPPQGDS
ncbi:MAG: hypothetical protein ACHQCG_01420 [Solirubrobacterales bacterium]